MRLLAWTCVAVGMASPAYASPDTGLPWIGSALDEATIGTGLLVLIPLLVGAAWVHDRVRSGGTPKVKLGATLGYAAGLVAKAFVAMPAPIAIMVAADVASSTLSPAAAVLASLVLFAAAIMLQASCGRLTLGDLDPSEVLRLRRGGLQFGTAEWRVIAATILLGLVLAGVAAGLAVIGVFAVWIGRMAAPGISAGVIGTGVAVVLGAGAIYALARTFTFVPAAILGPGLPLKESWKATRTSVLPAILVGMIQTAAGAAQLTVDPAFGSPMTQELGEGALLAARVGLGLLGAAATIFGMAAAAYVYRQLQAPSASDA